MYGYDVYTVTLVDIESIACLKQGYTGSSKIYDGGFIALTDGEDITAGEIAASNGEEITVTIDKTGKSISVTSGVVSSIDNIKDKIQRTAVYDLTGREVQEITQSGIYIVNGKKYIKR